MENFECKTITLPENSETYYFEKYRLDITNVYINDNRPTQTLFKWCTQHTEK